MRGRKRKRIGTDSGEGSAKARVFPCPVFGCQFKGVSDRAASIHLGKFKHEALIAARPTYNSGPSSSNKHSNSLQASVNRRHDSENGLLGDDGDHESSEQHRRQVQGDPHGPDERGGPTDQNSDDNASIGNYFATIQHIRMGVSSDQSGGDSDNEGSLGSLTDQAFAACPETAELNPEEETLQEILGLLAGRARDGLLRLVSHPNFDPFKTRWTSGRAFSQYLESVNKQASEGTPTLRFLVIIHC